MATSFTDYQLFFIRLQKLTIRRKLLQILIAVSILIWLIPQSSWSTCAASNSNENVSEQCTLDVKNK